MLWVSSAVENASSGHGLITTPEENVQSTMNIRYHEQRNYGCHLGREGLSVCISHIAWYIFYLYVYF